MDAPTKISPEVARRLVASRIAAGYGSSKSAAEAHGWSVQTFASHEGLRRAVAPHWAAEYARAFGVSATWLLTGYGDQTKNVDVIPLVGNIGVGGKISSSGSDVEPGRVVEVRLKYGIPGVEEAYCVDSLGTGSPYRPGSVVVCRDRVKNPTPYLGSECAVILECGEVYIREIHSGSAPTLYTLKLDGAADMVDVKVVSVAKVCGMFPKGEWERIERRPAADEVEPLDVQKVLRFQKA